MRHGLKRFVVQALLGVLLGAGVSMVLERATEAATPPGGGSGSYATTAPLPGTKPNGSNVTAVPPACAPNVNTTGAGSRKTPTNDWWTPLAWLDPNDLPDPAPLAPMTALT